ncbi:putative enzyme related to lactoylglutathione lyase [Peribacillus deserti]|uniref:Enzyme related to lactoylglutathione lyase n=1 Tax=Peribacillus deserti TaxID=673318 RepID=A0ABS2QGA8_9BACI|nr:VOC family protein [Peribacillus deserti]MBM7692192.1 putative enzyme related to lactoylglutathione lyase [Peribacillus deserti]
MIKQIGTVAVYVEDQQKAKTFWSEKVGFEIMADHPMGPNANWLEVAPKGVKTRLVIYPKSMMQGSENMKASIVFECDDIANTYEKLKANGVEFLGEPQEMEWGTFVQFKDEDGNQFLLKQ